MKSRAGLLQDLNESAAHLVDIFQKMPDAENLDRGDRPARDVFKAAR
jgi:hypothetical protein